MMEQILEKQHAHWTRRVMTLDGITANGNTASSNTSTPSEWMNQSHFQILSYFINN